jgi:carbonic anhydrase
MRRAGTLCLSALLVLAACDRSVEQAPGPEAGHAEQVHWGYEGEIGPEHWADLSADFELCRSGRLQSPIDLTGATPIEGLALQRERGQTVLTDERRARVLDLIDNGHTIQVTTATPIFVEIDGEPFELVQFHFHVPSEHTIDGAHAPLEVHFVHKSAQGELAVIGVFVEEGEHDPIWEVVIDGLPSGPEDPRHLEGLNIDVDELRELPNRYYRYEGSLTTPPCSEGVKWIVMSDAVQISPEQLSAFASRLHDNRRPVQPLGERELYVVGR